MGGPDTCWTPSGVRMRAARRNSGHLDWLFLPGGPGIGSESLVELVDTADLPGISWLVDLPGDGSNIDAPGAARDPYVSWPRVFLEAAAAVDNPVAVGHSTGGEYLLSIADLQAELRGLVLVSSAPDAGWMPTFEAMTRARPLPDVEAATRRYEQDPSDDTLRAIAVASAPWNFSAPFVETGRSLLSRMPYNRRAVEWSARNFDGSYQSAWWPTRMPTLVVSGDEDCIIDQTCWNDPQYRRPNVDHQWISAAGHWPWIDNPRACRRILQRFGRTVADRARLDC